MQSTNTNVTMAKPNGQTNQSDTSSVYDEEEETANNRITLITICILILLLLLLFLLMQHVTRAINVDEPTATEETVDDQPSYVRTTMPPPTPPPPPTTTTTSTTTTTTTPWHKMEYLCIYNSNSTQYLQSAFAQDKWPSNICQTLIFAKSDFTDANFADDVNKFKKFFSLKSSGTKFILATHVTGNTNPATNVAQKLFSAIKEHDFNFGGAMYVYKRTAVETLTDAFLEFAKYLKEQQAKALLLVEMYRNWQQQFALDKIAEKFVNVVFRTIDFIRQLENDNVQCKQSLDDTTGPKTFAESVELFIQAFNGKFDQLRRRIGFYAYKEGQGNATLPASRYLKECVAFAPLYGSCIYLAAYKSDTDCAVRYLFNEYVAKNNESFKAWCGHFVLILHEEQFDNTPNFSCTENGYVFRSTHPPT